MNEIDFFSADYTSRKLSARFFGIVDERPACVTTDVNQKDWDAVVENPESLELSFVPLDHQIVIRENPKTSEYSLREAYAANRQHPTFRHSAKSRMNEFRNETKFRLIITNRIKAK